MSGFRLKVDKGGLISLKIKDVGKNEKALKTPRIAIKFVLPDGDGYRFERCLRSLRAGDVIEVRFLPFLPKKEVEG